MSYLWILPQRAVSKIRNEGIPKSMDMIELTTVVGTGKPNLSSWIQSFPSQNGDWVGSGCWGRAKENLSSFTNCVHHISFIAPSSFPVLTLTTASLILLPQLCHNIHRCRNTVSSYYMPNSTKLGIVLTTRLLNPSSLIHSHL